MNFCECGKIASHKGMCSARWATRRENIASFDFDAALVNDRPRLVRMAQSWTHDRALAEDFVSEAVVKILAARNTFQPGTNFAAWCTTILKNVRNDHHRRAANRPTDSLTVGKDGEEFERADAALTVPPAQEDRIVVREMVSDLMKNTTPEQREVLLRSEMAGQNYEEIAAETGVSVGTVKSRAYRGRAGLEARVIRAVSDENSDSLDFVLAKLREERTRIDKAIAALEQCRSIFARGA